MGRLTKFFTRNPGKLADEGNICEFQLKPGQEKVVYLDYVVDGKKIEAVYLFSSSKKGELSRQEYIVDCTPKNNPTQALSKEERDVDEFLNSPMKARPLPARDNVKNNPFPALSKEQKEKIEAERKKTYEAKIAGGVVTQYKRNEAGKKEVVEERVVTQAERMAMVYNLLQKNYYDAKLKEDLSAGKVIDKNLNKQKYIANHLREDYSRSENRRAINAKFNNKSAVV